MFTRSIAKLSIGSLDEPSLSVDTHYNPKDLGFQRDVPWATHQLADRSNDQLGVEFTGSQPRLMTLEMFFDCFEQQDPNDARTIEQLVNVLETLATVRNPDGDEPHRRPHFCVVTWGDRGVKSLRCVITSLDVKYTMFDRFGKPLRALCTLKVREARLDDGNFDSSDDAQMAAMRRRMADRTEKH